MILSMTAFARKNVQGNWGTATWEIRSINHRYLEISLRLPEEWKYLEAILREKAQTSLQRGRIEATLKYNFSPKNSSSLQINQPLAKALGQTLSELNHFFQNPISLNACDLLQWPDLIQRNEENNKESHIAIVSLFQHTLEELVQGRQQEGASLVQCIEVRLNEVSEKIQNIKKIAPRVIEEQRQKIRACAKELQIELNPERFEEELLYTIQRADIAEELDRLETHIQAVQGALKQQGAMGRRLDFLMQELNREANTLSAKSTSVSITQLAVDLKVLIEQMREQIQNIE